MNELTPNGDDKHSGGPGSLIPVRFKKDVSAGPLALSPFSDRPPFDIEARKAIVKSAAHHDVMEHLPRFEAEFPDIFKLFELFNMHPGKDVQPWKAGETTVIEDFRNIGRHGLKAGRGVEILAGRLRDRGFMTDEQVRGAVRLGIAHDVNKPLEIFRKISGHANPYSDEAYEAQREYLRARGLPPEEVERFVDSGSYTGHLSFKRFIALSPENAFIGLHDLGMDKLLVHLVDSLTFSSKPNMMKKFKEPEINAFLGLEERMTASCFHHKGADRADTLGYPWMWDEGLTASEGKIIEVKDIRALSPDQVLLGHYAYIQKALGLVACGIVLDALGEHTTLQADKRVVEILNTQTTK